MSVSSVGGGTIPEDVVLGGPAPSDAPPAPAPAAVPVGTPGTRRPDPAAVTLPPLTPPAAPAASPLEAALAEMRASPHFLRLPPVLREPLLSVAAYSSDPAVVKDILLLVGSPGFHARFSDAGKVALVDVLAREPSSAGGLLASFGAVRALLCSADYERLLPKDREKINTILAIHPSAAPKLAEMIALASFRGLAEDEKQTLCDRIADAPDGLAAVDAALRDLSAREEAAKAGAAEVRALVDSLARPVATGLSSLFGSRDVPRGDDARERLEAILTGPHGNDVYRLLETEGGGLAHSLMSELVKDPEKPATRERLSRIAAALDPTNAAQFVSNLSHAIGKPLGRADVFDAVARGFTLRAGAAGLGLDLSGGSATVTADIFRLASTLATTGAGGAAGTLATDAASASRLSRFLPQLAVGFDPTLVRMVLKDNECTDYRNLLIEVLDQLTKSHELTNSPRRWNDDEKLEYFDAIRRLPGGGGAGEILTSATVPGRPPASLPRAAPQPAPYYPPAGYPYPYPYPQPGYPPYPPYPGSATDPSAAPHYPSAPAPTDPSAGPLYPGAPAPVDPRPPINP